MRVAPLATACAPIRGQIPMPLVVTTGCPSNGAVFSCRCAGVILSKGG
jgi:hypothetical protein